MTSTAKTSKIKKVVKCSEYDGKFGKTFYHHLEMENGDKIDIGKKKEQLVGWELTYDIVEGRVVGGSKLVIQNDKLKDLKIEKPLPLLDLSKYKVDSTCNDLLTELTNLQKDKKQERVMRKFILGVLMLSITFGGYFSDNFLKFSTLYGSVSL